jgi:hypothetical protein
VDPNLVALEHAAQTVFTASAPNLLKLLRVALQVRTYPQMQSTILGHKLTNYNRFGLRRIY